MMRTCLLLTSLFFSQFLFSQTATIQGNVSDQITKDGLPSAYISIGKTAFKKSADDKGNFEISGVPPGDYEMTIENIGYASAKRHVIVTAGQKLKIYILLAEQSKTLEQVTVFGRLDREKESGSRQKEKHAASISNIISSQAMVRSPDISAANVLQRMSGLTVQRSSGGNEAYAVIRGMEPRYNNTLLNGIKIASPDNKNRFVQLDIIPSDILSSIEISKSLMPDMEGDAIGGTINMVVKDAPEKVSFKSTVSVGYSQLFFNEKYMGFNKSAIQKLSPIQRNPSGYAAQPGDYSRSNLDFKPMQALPNGTVGFSYTRRFMHDKMGLVLADNLQNQYYGNISSRATLAPINLMSDSLQYQDITNFKGSTQQLNNGLVAHIDYVFNERNKINIDNFYIYSYLAQTRLSNDTTLLGTGRIGPGTGQIYEFDQSLTQHQYIENLKISGQHLLKPNLKFDWAGVVSEAGRRVPDLATIEKDYRIQADYTPTATYFDQITRQWQKNNDKDYTGIINLDYHKKWNGFKSLNLKIGGLYRSKTRYNNEDDYTLRPPSTSSGGGGNSKPVWTNIYDVQWSVYNTAGTNVYNPNNYKANETVFAGYAMATYTAKKWDAGGGLRLENTNTNWDDRVHSPTQPSSGNQTYQDLLPSAFFKYKLTSNQNLHLSYFKSISRPNYYELVYATTFTGDIFVKGNPYLQHSVADNFDIRYEIFPKGDQQIFVGAFYKKIQSPIEILLTNSLQSGIAILQPVNSSTANNYGAEITFTKYFGKFGITGNYTYVNTTTTSPKIKLTPAGATTIIESRPLQGQTNHIINFSLLYKDVKRGAFAQLAYQYQGKTLSEISLYYQSDYYQRPMNSLAFSIEKDIHNHFTLFGKFTNLLNTPSVQLVQNRLQASRDIYRATYSIGIRYDH